MIAMLLMFDAAFSPFGTTLVYTAATSRILYGMAENKHLPEFFMKLNRHKIPYITLFVNFLVGCLSFLPFPGWQKMVAFLSSTRILSYGAGPICLMAMRKLQPDMHRPLRLSAGLIFSHIGFFVCNLMLYWCGFSTIWKLCLALCVALIISLAYQRKSIFACNRSLYWFVGYMGFLLGLSYIGSFGGLGLIKFPEDIFIILPFSIITLYFSQHCLGESEYTTEPILECPNEKT